MSLKSLFIAAMLCTACSSATAERRADQKAGKGRATFYVAKTTEDGKIVLVQQEAAAEGTTYVGVDTAGQAECIECMLEQPIFIEISCGPADCNPPIRNEKGRPLNAIKAQEFKASVRRDEDGQVVIVLRATPRD